MLTFDEWHQTATHILLIPSIIAYEQIVALAVDSEFKARKERVKLERIQVVENKNDEKREEKRG